MNETELKSLLQIQDFRHITKDKVISLASSIDNLDPKVAMSVIEQFPNYIGALRACVSEMYGIANNAMAGSDADDKRAYKLLAQSLDVLRDELKRENLTTEERFDVLDRIERLNDKQLELNARAKQFKLETLRICRDVVLTVGIFGFMILGGKTVFREIPRLKL